ncbi:MAG TPA: DUF4388 domain-containing protein [Longimicrobiaceae bacterium]|nr:DUF4388 domain-containing protein [Longimicrobiaceae bacterium]
MAIEGSIRELALADLLQMLELARKTGVLTVRSTVRPHPVTVRFEKGAIVGAELPDAFSRLGHLLVRSGRLTEAELNEALRAQQAEPERPVGALLVSLGFAAEDDVRRFLHMQIEETICEVVRWTDGTFRFEDVPRLETGPVAVRLAPQALLMEAARRIDEWTTLEALVPHVDVVPVLREDSSGADGDGLDLRAAEWEVLAEVDGERTLRTIAKRIGRSDFEVARTVYGLITTGVLEILARPASDAPAPHHEGPPPAALAAVERALKSGEGARAQRQLIELLRTHPDSAEVYVLAGRASAMLRRWREASEALARATQQDPLSAEAHYHLGFAAAHAGQLSRAEEAWRTFLRLENGDARRANVARRAADAAAELRRVLDAERE